VESARQDALPQAVVDPTGSLTVFKSGITNETKSGPLKIPWSQAGLKMFMTDLRCPPGIATEQAAEAAGQNCEATVRNALKHFRTCLLVCSLVVILQPLPGPAQQSSNASQTSLQRAPTERDGQHDFDFEIGTWKTHLKRLQHPLTGSTTWVEYEGITVVRKVWNGRANMLELEADGPAGHFEGLNLRLYNPQSHQWSLNFANSNGGTMSQPTIGEFKNGRGEFFDQEPLNGRAILVRFVISDITPNSCRFEQSFSDDGGKTWEVNWIAIDTRVKDESEKAR
jgi:hypothetical protein